MTRSKIAQKIIEETPQATKDFVKGYADKKIKTYTSKQIAIGVFIAMTIFTILTGLAVRYFMPDDPYQEKIEYNSHHKAPFR